MQSGADESALWRAVAGGSDEEAAGALQALCADRASLGRLSHQRARLLLDRLARPSSQAAARTACWQLLARWCRTAAPASGGDPAFGALLAAATDAALADAGRQGRSPDEEAAVCLFLSCAAVAARERRRQCAQQLCEALAQRRALLTASGSLPELLGLLGRLCAAEQDPELVLWLAALTLRLWDCSEASADSLMLRQVAALGPAWHSLASAAAGAPAPAGKSLLRRLLGLLQATQEPGSSGQLQAAGLLAAAGCAEGAPQQAAAQLWPLIARACQAAGSSPAPAARGGAGWLAQQAAALAACRAHQACGQPALPPAALRCLLRCLLSDALSLQPLFAAAEQGRSPAEAGAALAAQQAGPVAQAAAALATLVSRGYSSAADAALRAELRQAVADAAAALSSGYAAYALAAQSEWLHALDGALVSAALRRAFALAVFLLTAFWRAAAAAERPALGAAVLDSLARLQFCCARSQAYAALLAAALPAVAADAQACLQLARCGPCYQALLQPVPAPGKAAGSGVLLRWQADAVLAAELQFRLRLLGPCCPQLPQAEHLDRLMPLTHLLLGHPQPPVAAAAHALFCSLLPATEQPEQLAPAYLARSLANFPGATPLPALTTGCDCLLRSLPVGSPAALLCFRRVGARAARLAAEQQRQQQGDATAAFLGLMHLLGYLLLVCDFQVLEAALAEAGSALRACPSSAQPAALEAIRTVLAGSDDYARKVRLVRWFQGLAAAVAAGA